MGKDSPEELWDWAGLCLDMKQATSAWLSEGLDSGDCVLDSGSGHGVWGCWRGSLGNGWDPAGVQTGSQSTTW